MKTNWTVALLTTVLLLGAGAAEARGKKDRQRLRNRTPDEVIEALSLALGAQDWDAVAENYADDAFIIDDQGVLVGHADIIASYQLRAMLFNGIAPTVLAQNTYSDTVRVLYRLDAGWILIPDGVDTFVIRRGLIRRQTSHGLIEFTGPPPDTQ